MSRQLALSAAFSTFAMAAYVLLGGNAVRAPLDSDSASLVSTVDVSAADVSHVGKLLPLMQ